MALASKFYTKKASKAFNLCPYRRTCCPRMQKTFGRKTSPKKRQHPLHYQVPDVVFPKHDPTFCPRLWSSTMLLRGGTRGSTVRGNVVINSTVPRRWDTAKRFRPASLWHLKITNTIDPWICHRNLIRSWVRSTIEYHSDPQPWPKPKTASKLKPDNWFSAQEMRVVGVACMKRTPTRNYTSSKWRQTILGSMPWITKKN